MEIKQGVQEVIVLTVSMTEAEWRAVLGGGQSKFFSQVRQELGQMASKRAQVLTARKADALDAKLAHSSQKLTEHYLEQSKASSGRGRSARPKARASKPVYKCIVCDQEYAKPGNLARHKSLVHGLAGDAGSSSAQTIQE